jgi:hypothetical protein
MFEYAIILGLVAIIAIGGGILVNKYNIKDSTLNFVQLLLDGVDYISSHIDYQYSGSVSEVLEYVDIAIELVEDSVSVTDINEKKQLIEDKTEEICKQQGIEVDQDLLKIIDEGIQFFIDEGILK